MRVVNGNRDYLVHEEKFIEYYNNPDMTVKEITKRLGITPHEFTLLRKKCNEEGKIKLRPAYRKKKQKHKPKYYSINYRQGKTDYYQVYRKGVYYCSCHTVREAELIVEKLKECDWDKSQIKRIKQEVKELIKNE